MERFIAFEHRQGSLARLHRGADARIGLDDLDDDAFQPALLLRKNPDRVAVEHDVDAPGLEILQRRHGDRVELQLFAEQLLDVDDPQIALRGADRLVHETVDRIDAGAGIDRHLIEIERRRQRGDAVPRLGAIPIPRGQLRLAADHILQGRRGVDRNGLYLQAFHRRDQLDDIAINTLKLAGGIDVGIGGIGPRRHGQVTLLHRGKHVLGLTVIRHRRGCRQQGGADTERRSEGPQTNHFHNPSFP